MPRLSQISIEGFRSISDQMVINFPPKKPVILIGENNAGKSNVIRAIELMFGEFHPKYKKLEDYDHYNRDTNNQIIIKANVTGLTGTLSYNYGHHSNCSGFIFRSNKGGDNDFVGIQSINGEENQYVRGDLREELLCVVVNSEQNLNYQLSYSSKYTLLSKVTKAFHDKLIGDEERVARLKDLFENIKATFMEVNEFKVFNTNMSTIADSFISNMTHALAFDFSAYDPSNYFRTLRVHPIESGETRAFEELGTGQQQILALSFAQAYAKSFLGQGLIFILDEPETHLHPLAQKWLAKKMFKMAEDGLQIIITTHSPYFIDLNYLDAINLIRKNDESTFAINTTPQELCEFCIGTGSNKSKTKEDSIIPFYANNSTPYILTGFFAYKIILVEGPTEELALPVYFERLGFDPTQYGVEVLGVGGKGNLAKWWRLFTLYQIPTFVCFDNDGRSDDSNGAKRKDALKAIGIEDDKVEKALSSKDWSLTKKFCVFGNDFEITMRNSFDDYVETEKSIIEQIGSSSKNLIARETAKVISLDTDSLGKEKLLELIENIENL